MTTNFDSCRVSNISEIIFPFDLKIKFFTHSICVCLASSFIFVLRYSHDLITKNMALINNHDDAISHFGGAIDIIFLTTIMGKAFCFILLLSRFLYALYGSVSKKHIHPSLSSLGCLLLFVLKVCTTYRIVALTDPSTKCSLVHEEKAPGRLPRKTDVSNSMLNRKVYQCFHLLICFDFVKRIIAD